jgi:hypothetical protein
MRKLSKTTMAMIIGAFLIFGFITIFNVILVEREPFNLEFKEARVFQDNTEVITQPMDIKVQGKLYRKKFNIDKSIDESKFLGSTKVKGIVEIDGTKYDVKLEKTKEENFFGFLQYRENKKDKYNGCILISDYPKKVNLFNYGK